MGASAFLYLDTLCQGWPAHLQHEGDREEEEVPHAAQPHSHTSGTGHSLMSHSLGLNILTSSHNNKQESTELRVNHSCVAEFETRASKFMAI